MRFTEDERSGSQCRETLVRRGVTSPYSQLKSPSQEPLQQSPSTVHVANVAPHAHADPTQLPERQSVSAWHAPPVRIAHISSTQLPAQQS